MQRCEGNIVPGSLSSVFLLSTILKNIVKLESAHNHRCNNAEQYCHQQAKLGTKKNAGAEPVPNDIVELNLGTNANSPPQYHCRKLRQQSSFDVLNRECCPNNIVASCFEQLLIFGCINQVLKKQCMSHADWFFNTNNLLEVRVKMLRTCLRSV